jgi:hypothetical protein
MGMICKHGHRSASSLGGDGGGLLFGAVTRQSGSLEGIKAAESSKQGTTEGFTFLGLISLSDPPKEGVAESVGQLTIFHRIL